MYSLSDFQNLNVGQTSMRQDGEIQYTFFGVPDGCLCVIDRTAYIYRADGAGDYATTSIGSHHIKYERIQDNG